MCVVTKPQYLAQCMNGHVINIPQDSELEKRAIESEKKGRIDAIGISCDDCPECEYDARIRRENDEYLYEYNLADLISKT